jgi:Rho-binding antiterminator
MIDTYSPIDCTFHDRLEALATTRRRVVLSLASEDGLKSLAEGVITDIWTAPTKEEFLRLDGEEPIRLDRILAIRRADSGA